MRFGVPAYSHPARPASRAPRGFAAASGRARQRRGFRVSRPLAVAIVALSLLVLAADTMIDARTDAYVPATASQSEGRDAVRAPVSSYPAPTPTWT